MTTRAMLMTGLIGLCSLGAVLAAAEKRAPRRAGKPVQGVATERAGHALSPRFTFEPANVVGASSAAASQVTPVVSATGQAAASKVAAPAAATAGTVAPTAKVDAGSAQVTQRAASPVSPVISVTASTVNAVSSGAVSRAVGPRMSQAQSVSPGGGVTPLVAPRKAPAGRSPATPKAKSK